MPSKKKDAAPEAKPVTWNDALNASNTVAKALTALSNDGTRTGRVAGARAVQALGNLQRALAEGRDSLKNELEERAKQADARQRGADERKKAAEAKLVAAHADLKRAEAEAKEAGV